MTDAYQVAIGNDNEVELATLAPQPALPQGIQTSRRVFAASGNSYPDGEQYADLTYTIMTPEQFNEVNTDLGISETTTSSDNTFTLRQNDGSFGNFNGTVHYPEIGKDARRTPLGFENVRYRVTKLEAL